MLFQQLDDPVALPPSSHEQRQATISRGKALRRQQRTRVIAIPLATVAVAASFVGLFAWVSSPAEPGALQPAAPSVHSSVLLANHHLATPAYTGCTDPVGDSVGEPDLERVSMDGPPFLSVHWNGRWRPPAGTVDVILGATSADGQRSRQLVVHLLDGKVVDQFVRDPRTGRQQSLSIDANSFAEISAHGLGEMYPAAVTNPLGDGWTWTASVLVNGIEVDSCTRGN